MSAAVRESGSPSSGQNQRLADKPSRDCSGRQAPSAHSAYIGYHSRSPTAAQVFKKKPRRTRHPVPAYTFLYNRDTHASDLTLADQLCGVPYARNTHLSKLLADSVCGGVAFQGIPPGLLLQQQVSGHPRAVSRGLEAGALVGCFQAQGFQVAGPLCGRCWGRLTQAAMVGSKGGTRGEQQPGRRPVGGGVRKSDAMHVHSFTTQHGSTYPLHPFHSNFCPCHEDGDRFRSRMLEEDGPTEGASAVQQMEEAQQQRYVSTTLTFAALASRVTTCRLTR